MKSVIGKKLRELADKMDEEARIWGTPHTQINVGQLRQLAKQGDEEVENLHGDLEHYDATSTCHECGCNRRRDELTQSGELYCENCIELVERERADERDLHSMLNQVAR